MGRYPTAFEGPEALPSGKKSGTAEVLSRLCLFGGKGAVLFLSLRGRGLNLIFSVFRAVPRSGAGYFALGGKVTKAPPAPFGPDHRLCRTAVRVKSCECLRTADSFGFLIYGTILSNFGCRPPHSIALRAALRIGAYGLLKGKIYPYIFVQLWRLAESPAPVRRPSRNASLVYSSMTRSRSSLS